MPKIHQKWYYLALLSLIWGSSFILIKKGLVGLTDYQLGSLRIVLTSIFLFIVGFKSLGQIKQKDWKWVALSGLVSSFFPPFLFAIAQSHIDSAVASILNSLTPLATALVGVAFFQIVATKRQILGVIIGLIGTSLLILAGAEVHQSQDYSYSLLILLATLGYAFNVNIIKRYLGHVSALAVTTGNFVFIVLPALGILMATGFFATVFESPEMQKAVGFVAILSLIGTAFAKVVFNKLVQIASPVFASSVTYTMPIVAVLWGVFDGERFSVWQLVAAAIILFGVFLSNKRQR